MADLRGQVRKQLDKVNDINMHRSFQKFFSSSMVLEAPRIRANNTSTPPSPMPQKELQKSRDRFPTPGEFSLAYFDKEVVEGCRFADISWLNCVALGAR